MAVLKRGLNSMLIGSHDGLWACYWYRHEVMFVKIRKFKYLAEAFAPASGANIRSGHVR